VGAICYKLKIRLPAALAAREGLVYGRAAELAGRVLLLQRQGQTRSLEKAVARQFALAPARPRPVQYPVRRQPHPGQERRGGYRLPGPQSGPDNQRPVLGDNQGLSLAVATPQPGNQHDTFELERVFAELCSLLEAAELRLDGFFLNTDKAFDVNALRQAWVRTGVEANIPRNRRSVD
jgi:hypothetical protein